MIRLARACGTAHACGVTAAPAISRFCVRGGLILAALHLVVRFDTDFSG
jgi:hypothetical protein